MAETINATITIEDAAVSSTLPKEVLNRLPDVPQGKALKFKWKASDKVAGLIRQHDLAVTANAKMLAANKRGVIFMNANQIVNADNAIEFHKKAIAKLVSKYMNAAGNKLRAATIALNGVTEDREYRFSVDTQERKFVWTVADKPRVTEQNAAIIRDMNKDDKARAAIGLTAEEMAAIMAPVSLSGESETEETDGEETGESETV